MAPNKDRLYVALHARAGKPSMPGLEDTYHWSLFVGPKKETATSTGCRFHAKETLSLAGSPPRPTSTWHYTEEPCSAQAPSAMVLVRILVAKVEDMDALRAVFAATPLRPETAGWNCVGWVQEALQTAVHDGRALGTAVHDWPAIRDAAMRYVEQKKTAHRFDGTVAYDQTKTATWDLLRNVELVP